MVDTIMHISGQPYQINGEFYIFIHFVHIYENIDCIYITVWVLLIIIAIRFKFDDERVTKEDLKRALEEQYGGEEEVMRY